LPGRRQRAPPWFSAAPSCDDEHFRSAWLSGLHLPTDAPRAACTGTGASLTAHRDDGHFPPNWLSGSCLPTDAQKGTGRVCSLFRRSLRPA
jgi:hypothetical protein